MNETINDRESAKIVSRYFSKDPEPQLLTLVMKDKNKRLVLREISKRFEPQKIYGETEVNLILRKIHEDYMSLRRYLVEYGFLDRKNDGSQYWLKEKLEG